MPGTIPVSIGDKFGSYEILAPLGAGGMGEVYKARDTRLGRTVALKLLPPELAADPVSRRRLLQEAQAASSLNHPNIVVLYDISSHEGRDFLVMEYVAGRTLKELISPGGLPFDQLAGLGSQVALALGTAHAAGVVHRDVKPANIIFTADRQAKVLDFGIARISRGISQDDTVTNLTDAGHVIGTVAYMSPEQVRGGEADFCSDIFSLGCVLYEAATGKRPFQAGNNLRLMHEIATADPVPLKESRPDLPAEFSRLVMRCLEKNPGRRPESAIELATELRALTLPVQPAARSRSSEPSLAVIPMQVRGPAAEQYLSISLAEALINRLSSTGRLLVRPIASVIRYAGKEVEWVEVARELNVDLVVEGAIQTVGGKIRVLIQAHRVNDSHTLASIKQDGDSSDLFGLQDRLGDAVSDVFVPRQKSGTAPGRMPPTRNAGAFELYLRAVDRQVHVDKFDTASAIELLTHATALDPTFADAWGLLAQCCAQMGAHLDPDPKWFELGERAITKALELDPVQCDALCARGWILWSPSRSFQNRAALRALNAALKIDPMRPTARHQRAAVLWHLGFLDAAWEDAEELHSNSALALMQKGAILLIRGDYDRSTECYNRALSLDPSSVLTHLIAPMAPLWAGRRGEAREALARARQMFPDESFAVGLDAILAGLDGNSARAESLADEASASRRSMTHTHHTWHSCAAAYALSGKPDKALAELERCAAMGLPNYRMFQMDPHLRSLHDNPGFQNLMTRLRREHDSIRDEFGLEQGSDRV
jgi:serine/threonine protein kinase/tetratricopeptide (TPR) repeat protein